MHDVLPDVVSDPVVSAAKALNLPNIEMLFYKAAEDAGFTNPQAVAAHRYNQYKYDGFSSLPPYLRDFCLRQISIHKEAHHARPARDYRALR